MTLTLTAYGIAKDILGGRSLQVEIPVNSTLAEVKQHLCELYPAFTKLVSLKLAVNASYQTDTYRVQAGDELVIIPPVSGG